MNCRQYIFLLTSDQLGPARPLVSAQARWHWMACTACRDFTRNDRALLDLFARQRQAELERLKPPGKS